MAGVTDPGYSGSSAKHGMERVLRENMFDVGNEKLLMLLFVVKTENEHRFHFFEKRFIGFFEQFDHAIVD